jgi:integrase/recombinase XerD
MNKIKNAVAQIWIGNRCKCKDGNYIVQIRVTHERKQKYYSTGVKISKPIFDKVMFGLKKTSSEKETYNLLTAFLNKAETCIKKLGKFNFEKFVNVYTQKRSNNLEDAYKTYITELNINNQTGSASNYSCSIKSLLSFKKDLNFDDIDVPFLKKYEQFMLQNGKSITTIGFYLRPLQCILNRAIRSQNITLDQNPFGKDKYSIPKGANNKRSLKEEDIKSIFDYKAKNELEELAQDFWIFSYLCGGMNMVDILQLKNKNIEGDIISFIREKTKRSTSKTIRVSLKEQAREVIIKYCKDSNNPNAYIFGIVNDKMTATEKNRLKQNFTRKINTQLGFINNTLKLPIELTTYTARHSFATILKNKNAPIAMISELLGHSSIKTTQIYLGSFEDNAIHSITDLLLPK